VPFALHTLHLWKRPWRDVDLAVEKTMSDYWVNFVKKGNPNGEDLPEWGVYDKFSGNIMEIGDKAKLYPALHKDEFEFLDGVNKR
jgi:para-nitrobenzyl esterase